jgi:hypothetical protein
MVPILAAASKKREEEEEERAMLRQLRRDDPESRYEYKLLRSHAFAFRRPERRQAILDEEMLAGWEMIAKLDDSRMVMRRPRSAREADSMLPPDVDPFRTEVDTNMPLVMGIVLALSLVVGLLVAALIGYEQPGVSAAAIPVVLIAIGVFAVLVMAVVVGAVARR